MSLSSLNVDVFLHLMKFVKPVDRFNLLLSGILKGFENVKEGIDLHKRIEYFGIEMGLRRDFIDGLEIRSLTIHRPADSAAKENLLLILQRLVEDGFLKNNRQFAIFDCSRSPRFVEVIFSMNNLQKLDLWDCELTLEQVSQLFRSCPKLIELHLKLSTCEMDEDLKDQLRPGIQKLQIFELEWYIDIKRWSLIQEMCTWLKECVQLSLRNNYWDYRKPISHKLYGSLTLNPDLAQTLGTLNLKRIPVELVQWILSACLNTHSLKLDLIDQPNDLHNEIARLKKLKVLDVTTWEAGDMKEIVRVCRQVEILRIDVVKATLQGFAEMEPFEHTTEVHLRWGKGPSIEEILPTLKKWQHLRRLTLRRWHERSVPPLVLLDFIMGMEHLTYLHIVPIYNRCNCDQLETLRDQVNNLVLPHRPNFQFDVSEIPSLIQSRNCLR